MTDNGGDPDSAEIAAEWLSSMLFYGLDPPVK